MGKQWVWGDGVHPNLNEPGYPVCPAEAQEKEDVSSGGRYPNRACGFISPEASPFSSTSDCAVRNCP